MATLRDTTADPTLTVGDTISLGAALTDTLANPATTVAFSALSGSFSADSTPPTLSSLATADTTGDGYLDRLVLGFSENVNAAALVAGNFSLSAGSISGVLDNGAPADAILWVNITDGVLASNATPSLTIAPAGIQDLPGNPNALISAFPSSDAAGPALWSAVASDATVIQAGIDSDDTVSLTFSEPVDTSNAGGGNLVAGDFAYGNLSAGGATGIAGLAGLSLLSACGQQESAPASQSSSGQPAAGAKAASLSVWMGTDYVPTTNAGLKARWDEVGKANNTTVNFDEKTAPSVRQRSVGAGGCGLSM